MSIPTDRDLLVNAAGNLLNAANGFEPLNATLARRLAAAVINDKSFGVDYLSRTLMESASMAADWMPNQSAQQVAVPQGMPSLGGDELKALHRFAETCEDGQEYDIPKAMMQRLAKIGVVRRVTASIYEATNFGEAVLATAPPPPQAERVPMTDAEIREWWASENGLEDCDLYKLDDFTKVVRAFEAHHHIGGKP